VKHLLKLDETCGEEPAAVCVRPGRSLELPSNITDFDCELERKNTMYVVCVTIRVVPDHLEDFIQATRANHLATRGEPGNVRFDVLQEVDDPTRFLLYEVYRSEKDFKAHQTTEHYFGWRHAVADWMAEKRVGVKHESLFPADPEF